MQDKPKYKALGTSLFSTLTQALDHSTKSKSPLPHPAITRCNHPAMTLT